MIATLSFNSIPWPPWPRRPARRAWPMVARALLPLVPRLPPPSKCSRHSLVTVDPSSSGKRKGGYDDEEAMVGGTGTGGADSGGRYWWHRPGPRDRSRWRAPRKRLGLAGGRDPGVGRAASRPGSPAGPRRHRGERFQSMLDRMVANGRLTQEEANERWAQYQAASLRSSPGTARAGLHARLWRLPWFRRRYAPRPRRAFRAPCRR